MRLEPATREDVLMEEPVDGYRVQIYFWPYGPRPGTELVYRVLKGTKEVVLRSRADERRFPKRAAHVGTVMVEAFRLGMEMARAGAEE